MSLTTWRRLCLTASVWYSQDEVLNQANTTLCRPVIDRSDISYKIGCQIMANFTLDEDGGLEFYILRMKMMHKTCWGNKMAWKVGKKKGKGWKRGEKEEEFFFGIYPISGKNMTPWVRDTCLFEKNIVLFNHALMMKMMDKIHPPHRKWTRFGIPLFILSRSPVDYCPKISITVFSTKLVPAPKYSHSYRTLQMKRKQISLWQINGQKSKIESLYLAASDIVLTTYPPK